MNRRLLTKSIITWFLFIPIAITNGIIREVVYKPHTGDLVAHWISTIIAATAFITLSYFMLRNKLQEVSNSKLFLLGLLWVLMTITFEFGFGHYIDGASWDKLFTDYNIFQGHIWGLFLLVILLTPLIVKKIKKEVNMNEIKK